jgi:large subunit ribosomal protein L32
MPVPKKRRSKARRRRYHAHFKVYPAGTAKCPNCGEAFLPHTICPVCGFYKGKKVLVTKAEKSAARKVRKKEEEKKNKGK